MAQISIHALCEEGDHCGEDGSAGISDFYPRPLRGGRPKDKKEKRPHGNFYPRPLRGGRLAQGHRGDAQYHFYPRPLRGGRLFLYAIVGRSIRISIHALCEEGDPLAHRAQPNPAISIHALCEEGDGSLNRPARGTFRHFYPRPLRGGRPPKGVFCWPRLGISIHALCEEGDLFTVPVLMVAVIFLSTPSARRATDRPVQQRPPSPISIHALCEEGDPPSGVAARPVTAISIHALCEEGDKPPLEP